MCQKLNPFAYLGNEKSDKSVLGIRDVDIVSWVIKQARSKRVNVEFFINV